MVILFSSSVKDEHLVVVPVRRQSIAVSFARRKPAGGERAVLPDEGSASFCGGAKGGGTRGFASGLLAATTLPVASRWARQQLEHEVEVARAVVAVAALGAT